MLIKKAEILSCIEGRLVFKPSGLFPWLIASLTMTVAAGESESFHRALEKVALVQAGPFLQVLECKTEPFELAEKPVASEYFWREDSFFLVFLIKFLTPPSGKGLKRKWMKTF